MQLWLNDPNNVEKLMDMKRMEKKGTAPSATQAPLIHTCAFWTSSHRAGGIGSVRQGTIV